MPFRRYIVRTSLLTAALLLGAALAACQGAAPTVPSTPNPDTPATPAATEAPAGPRTLVYCTSQDPGSLYRYAQDADPRQQETVLQAIYDGPIDNRGFDFQPVILEALPTLENGGMRLEPVTVQPGNTVVDAHGDVVTLEAGVRLRPSGCQTDGCAVLYDGRSELQMDRQSAVFTLLPDLVWSDGAPLTAADSVYAHRLATDPSSPIDPYFFDRWASYTALDEQRVEWTGLPGYLDAEYHWNFIAPLPEHAWGQTPPAELQTAEAAADAPLGWGPYVIAERVPGESLTLARNENYFRADENLPRFERLVFRFVGQDVDASLDRLLAGECDLVDSAAVLPALQAEQAGRLLELQGQGALDLQTADSAGWENLVFGIQPQSYDDGWQEGDRPDFFSDVRTRQAFALCLDRAGLAAGRGLGEPAVPLSYVHPAHPLYNPDAAQYPYDPGVGAALLEEAGWQAGPDGVRTYSGDNPRIPAGTRLAVTLETLDQPDRQESEQMAASLAGCGIELAVNYRAFNELFATGPEAIVFGRNFDLAQIAWELAPTPACDLFQSPYIPGEDRLVFRDSWGGANAAGFVNAGFDQACEAARGALPGQPAYAENHRLAQAIFAEQLPAIPLYFHERLALTRPDFCGQALDPSQLSDAWNVEAFDVGPDC